VNPKYYRTLENETLLRSAEKARRVLGWQPKYTFDDLVREMVSSDIRAVKAGEMFAHTYLDLDWLVDESSEAPKAPIYGIESNGDIHDNGQNTAVQLTA
jgi:GDP-D-mannose dehydratase